MKSRPIHLGCDDARICHVEGTLEIVADEQGVVFGRLFQHAVAAVGADEIKAARRLSLKAVQRGGCLRERDDVEISVVVVVHDGRQIHANADDGELARPAAEVEARGQVQRSCAERRSFSRHGGVFKHPNPIHVACENVRLSVAVEVAEKAPIHQRGEPHGPFPIDRQVSVGQALKDHDSTSVSVERHQVVVPIQVGVEGRPLRGGQSPGPSVVE